jgi:hypothetical protein
MACGGSLTGYQPFLFRGTARYCSPRHYTRCIPSRGWRAGGGGGGRGGAAPETTDKSQHVKLMLDGDRERSSKARRVPGSVRVSSARWVLWAEVGARGAERALGAKGRGRCLCAACARMQAQACRIFRVTCRDKAADKIFLPFGIRIPLPEFRKIPKSVRIRSRSPMLANSLDS